MPTASETTLRLAWEPVWSWPVSVLVAVGLLVFVLLTYPPRVRHLPDRWRRLLLALRLGTALALAVSVLRPEFQWSKTERKASMLVVLLDDSRSMQTPDGPGAMTRRAQLVKAMEDSEPTFAALRKEMEVRFLNFDREPRPVEKPEAAALGEQSAIGFSLESVLRESQGQGLSGIILLSDGAQKALAPHDVDPRAVARRLGDLQIPIFPVAFGTTSVSDTTLDLIVEDLLLDPIAFVKKTVPLRAKIRTFGAAGRKLTVRLLVEDLKTRDGLKSGDMKVPPASKNAQPVVQIEPTRNADVIPVELSFVPDLPGEYKIAVEVVPIEGEIKQTNNSRATLLTVRKGGITVAYFDTVNRDLKFLKMLKSTDQIQLDWQKVVFGRLSGLTDIDAEWFQRGRYDVFVIGDVPAKIFGPQLLKQMAARVDEGAGLMMLGGLRSFGAGGYAETPLADLLPVAMRPNETQPDDEVDPSLRHPQELTMVPTRRGLSHYVMRIDSPDQNRAAWEKLPPLDTAAKLRPKNDFVEILAESTDGVPLLFATEVGRARVMAFGGNTTFRWVLQGQRAAHQRFWRQTIFWLAHKEDDLGQAVWVRIDPRNYHPGAAVQIAFGARTPDGAPLADVDFDVAVINPEGAKQKLTSQGNAQESTTSFNQTDLPGDYWISIGAFRDKQLIGGATSRFLVDQRDLELDNPAADHALLADLANLTGGSLITPEGHAAFLERLLKEGLVRREETDVTHVTLWDNWPFLILFVTLLTAEWTIRKLRGLV